MSNKAIKRVLEHSRQRGSALALMLILANHVNQQSVCWLKVETLAGELRRKPRQTQNLLRRVEAAGEIECRCNESGQHLANYYLVKVGDASIRWPRKLPEQRVQFSTDGCNSLPDGCNSLPERVQFSTEDGCNSLRRVQFSTKNGCNSLPDIKEEEPPIEPPERNTEEEEAAKPIDVPDALVGFDAEFRGQEGYRPSVGFYRTVQKKYAGELDLVEQAVSMVDWLNAPNKKFKGQSPRAAGRQCNTLFILGWLRRSLDEQGERRSERGGRNGTAAIEHSGSGVRAGELARPHGSGVARQWTER